MKMETLLKAVELGNKLKNVLLATADETGLPHIASAGKLSLPSGEGLLTVGAWFCPGTVKNLEHNRKIAVLVWDEVHDTGYQLLGEVEEVKEFSFLDGYSAAMEGRMPSPQVERELSIKVKKIIAFSRAPHSDMDV
jgi:uncharacterized protein